MVARYAHRSPAHLQAAVERLVEVSRKVPDGALAEAPRAAVLPYLRLGLITPGWRNWKTRQTQNLVPFGAWGFDSPSRHQGRLGTRPRECREAKSEPSGVVTPRAAISEPRTGASAWPWPRPWRA
jgi:hypothetical protein